MTNQFHLTIICQNQLVSQRVPLSQTIRLSIRVRDLETKSTTLISSISLLLSTVIMSGPLENTFSR
jgi:hypothetical protein